MESVKREFVSVEDALASKAYFILGLLSKYLTSKGMANKIVKKKKSDLSPQEKEENKKIFQILVNSFRDDLFMELTLNCGGKGSLYVTNDEMRNDLIDKLKGSLSKYFELNEKEIEVKPPKYSTGTSLVKGVKVLITFKKKPNKIINLDNLDTRKKLEDAISFKIDGYQTNFLLDTVYLNRGILNAVGDVDDDDYGEGEERGGREYFPPKGWMAKGLEVSQQFGDDSWLGFVEGDEWCISYYGGKCSDPKCSEYKNNRDEKSQNGNVGEGVYNTPKPEVMLKEAPVFEANKKKYKLGFMVRVHPDRIRYPVKNANYWIVEGDTSEIRPYRILYKEVK